MALTTSFLIFAVLSVAHVYGLPNLHQFGAMKIGNFIHEFEIPKTDTKTGVADGPHKLTLKKFSFKDCDDQSSLVNIKSLSISPDPLAFPGPLEVSADFIVKENLESKLSAKLDVKRKFLGKYIELPCIDNFGSCEYDDVCAFLTLIPESGCPATLTKIGIDCRCPIKKGTYNLSKTSFTIQAGIIPSGDYEVVANVTHSGEEVACLNLTVTLQ